MSFIRYTLEHLGGHKSKDCFLWKLTFKTLKSKLSVLSHQLISNSKTQKLYKNLKNYLDLECKFKSAIPNSIDSSQICLPVLVLLRTTGVWAAQHCSVRLLFLKLICFVLTQILSQFTLKINTMLLVIFRIHIYVIVCL